MPDMIYPFDAHLVREAPTREIAAHCNGRFPISIQFVYFFQFIVPVVQRIEQEFPKVKAAFLLEFADVISCVQITAFKRVE